MTKIARGRGESVSHHFFEACNRYDPLHSRNDLLYFALLVQWSILIIFKNDSVVGLVKAVLVLGILPAGSVHGRHGEVKSQPVPAKRISVIPTAINHTLLIFDQLKQNLFLTGNSGWHIVA